MRRLHGFLGAAALAASGVLSAQTAALKPVEALPDPVRPVLAEVAYAHPLFLALEEPPKVLERPNPVDLETRVPLVLVARDAGARVLDPEHARDHFGDEEIPAVVGLGEPEAPAQWRRAPTPRPHQP